MIKSETYQGVSGLSYIQDSELAFATIYVVKREGTQHDRYVSGSTNRTYIHDSSTGKVSFPTAFTPGDERVFVLYKVGGGAEPPIIPGVCVPVAVTATTLPNAIVNQAYGHTIYLTGTGPFVVTPVTIPTGMTLTNSLGTIFLSGTPTIVQTETLEFNVSNCSAGSTANFNQSFEVVDPAVIMTIHNSSGAGVFINSMSGIPYTIQSGTFPIAYLRVVSVVHPAYTGQIFITVSGVIFPYSLKLYVNDILIQTMAVGASGIYDFASQTYLSSDRIQIILE